MTVHQIVNLLNEANAADPVAMKRLVRASAPCNDRLAAHPRVVCWSMGEGATLSWLGILIGIASLDGLGIEAIWSEDLDDLIGFGVVNYSIEDELAKRSGQPVALEYSKTFNAKAAFSSGESVSAKSVVVDGETMWAIARTSQTTTEAN